eukprot:TRINITY_DN779914_c0_g1_i1.p1 TRINITY_DN779914_c0_g1~~TRINITY_DN779914_c0_g1_i1.p1  ORF type:complete len:180 (+),score=49.59 TRINITY_DN779914_c0_g1_i1:101-640(+)
MSRVPSSDGRVLGPKLDTAEFITNREVFERLAKKRQHNERRKKFRKGAVSKESEWVQNSTFKYLESTPCIHESIESITNFVSDVKNTMDFPELTKAERLQCVNLCPTSSIEVNLIVEECPERLDEDQEDALIEMCAKLIDEKEVQKVEEAKKAKNKGKKNKENKEKPNPEEISKEEEEA